MFRQVQIHPDHSKFQKILWRDSLQETVQTYQLDTVTYGTAPAPFLAVRTLKQLAEDEGQAFPSAAHALQHDFYVDDLITAADTVSQAAQLRDELIKLLSLGGSNLRQWASNEEALVKPCNEQVRDDTVHFNASETKRTLGVCWNAKLDAISYSVSMDATSQRITKRVMLSQIAKLFDRLGLLGAVIILAKILMQELWKSKLDWDESVPQAIHTAWTNYGSGFKGSLSVVDLNKAHEAIIKRTQGQTFPSELKHLRAKEPLDRGSKLITLNPFLDNKGIIRVGGRLSNADIRYAQKHPVVLPKSHPAITLIISFEHLQTLQGTLDAVRQRCVQCFKTKPTGPPDYLIGNLPRDRLVTSRPFENTGVDYCGPLFVKERRFRNQKRIKVYVAVFICFLTETVPFELVSDLTTEAFLAVLSRFFARRGLVEIIRSRDHNDRILQRLANDSIVWHFSPPRSPHFGGLWEAATSSTIVL
ncbi:uncharacterized protein LOC144477852 [Augochlora pura]